MALGIGVAATATSLGAAAMAVLGSSVGTYFVAIAEGYTVANLMQCKGMCVFEDDGCFCDH